MGMKRTELEKLKGKKVEGLQKASGPYRSPDGGEDRRERRRREREMGLVPFAVKLDGELVSRIRERAAQGGGDLNATVAELLSKGLEAK